VTEFVLTNSNRFYLPGTRNQFLHLATIAHNFKTYMCFVDKKTEQTYIENISSGQLEFIEDDSLVQSIVNFLIEQGIIQAAKPTLPDSLWLPTNKTKKIFL